MTQLHTLLLLAMVWAGVALAGLAPQIKVTVRTNNIVDSPQGAVSTSSTLTAGIQEAFNALPKVTTVTGIGGGEVEIAAGTYFISTNLWIPGKWPTKLHVKGAGDQATFIIYTGPTNTGLVRCEAMNSGAVTGLTNNINLEWEGCTLSYVTNSTNFIFALENVNFVKIHDNTLVNYECLTNGNGIYTFCYEGNVPTAIPGTAGISLYWANEPNSGQGTFNIYGNMFYGLACAFHNGGVRGRFHDNHVNNIGMYFNGSVVKYHTNAFRFDYTQLPQQGRAGITTGAAIVSLVQGQTIIYGNHFSLCGPVLYQDTANANLATVGAPTILFGNTYESVETRVACWNDGYLSVGGYEFGLTGPAGEGVNGFPPDVVVTNSATKVQPKIGTYPTTDYVTGFKIYPQSAFAAGGGYIAVNGLLAVSNGITGNGAGLTNLPVSGLASLGTVLSNGNSFAATVSNQFRVDITHAFVASNAAASALAGFDAAHQMTNVNIGSGLSLSLNTLSATSVADPNAITNNDTRSINLLGTSNYVAGVERVNGSFIATNGSDYIGPLNFQADLGGPLVDISVTSATANGTKIGYTNLLDGSDMVRTYATSDGAGAVTSPTVEIPSGVGFSPLGNTPYTVYAVGTAYTLTTTPAALDFGTTDPSVTLGKAGTYLIIANAGVLYSGATYAGAQTVTLKLRRTNNTAADLTSGGRTVELPVLTTFTGGDAISCPPVLYTTANANDAITIFGSVSALPAAGSVQTDSAEIVAIRLY